MPSIHRITPCLWFDREAEEAVQFYISVFPNSRVTRISRYADVGQGPIGPPAGSVMTVAFDLDGLSFTALNGGPVFKFSEAISLQINCETQEEVDYYWEALGAGGDPEAQRCGWLKDRFGLSWQVVPAALAGMITDPDAERARRVAEAMLRMKKLDLADLQRAYGG
jgi:predicted 3-demethylubiquinone-9 3-methyltransferase (glyoxalase superfamily)